jgi:hypothetical protein
MIKRFNRRIASGAATVLFFVGGLWCFLAVMHRIDGPDDFHDTLVADLFVGIPIAVGVIFKWVADRRLEAGWNWNLQRRVILALGIWAATALVLIGWHCQQIAARGGTDILRQWLHDFWKS